VDMFKDHLLEKIFRAGIRICSVPTTPRLHEPRSPMQPRRGRAIDSPAWRTGTRCCQNMPRPPPGGAQAERQERPSRSRFPRPRASLIALSILARRDQGGYRGKRLRAEPGEPSAGASQPRSVFNAVCVYGRRCQKAFPPVAWPRSPPRAGYFRFATTVDGRAGPPLNLTVREYTPTTKLGERFFRARSAITCARG